MKWSDLSSHFRLSNFIKSGASEEKVESFVDNINSSNLPPEKVVELVYQLYEISNTESIPLDQIPSYIERKLEEKRKIDEQIKENDATLQSKSVTIEAINEHLKLKEELDRHGVSMQDTDKLLKLLSNAKRYGFDDKEFADKLFNIQELEWKEKQLKGKCKKFSKRISKFKDVVPLSEAIAAWGIGIDQLLALKVGIDQAAKHYNLPPLAATLRLIDDIKKYNKINGLKEELSALYLRKFAINEACSSQSQSLIALAKLKSYGLTEDRILQLSECERYQGQIQQERNECYSLQNLHSRLKEGVDSCNQSLAVYAKLFDMGFSLKELKLLWHTISEIADANNIPREDAVKKFFKDVEDHYDDKLGFESKVGSIQEELNHLDQKKTKLLTGINIIPQLALALGKLLSVDDNNSIEEIKSLVDQIRKTGGIKEATDKLTNQSIIGSRKSSVSLSDKSIHNNNSEDGERKTCNVEEIGNALAQRKDDKHYSYNENTDKYTMGVEEEENPKTNSGLEEKEQTAEQQIEEFIKSFKLYHESP